MLNQFPRKKSAPVALCQNTAILSKITAVNYNIEDQFFIAYAVMRLSYVLDFSCDLWKAETNIKNMQQHTLLIRAQLQDVWEIYHTSKSIEMIATEVKVIMDILTDKLTWKIPATRARGYQSQLSLFKSIFE